MKEKNFKVKELLGVIDDAVAVDLANQALEGVDRSLRDGLLHSQHCLGGLLCLLKVGAFDVILQQAVLQIKTTTIMIADEACFVEYVVRRTTTDCPSNRLGREAVISLAKLDLSADVGTQQSPIASDGDLRLLSSANEAGVVCEFVGSRGLHDGLRERSAGYQHKL